MVKRPALKFLSLFSGAFSGLIGGFAAVALAYTVTANMSLKIPSSGDTDYPTSISDSFTLIDQHDHSPGKGILIGTNGIANSAVTTAKIADGNVTLAKLDATALQSFIPAGSVLPYGGSSAPTGFFLGNGATVSRTTYAALFAVYGVRFGSGDGSTTFHLPDCRGRFVRFHDNGVARDEDRATRTAMNAGGATGDNIGSIQGDQFSSHNHGGGDHRHTYLTDQNTGGPPLQGGAGSASLFPDNTSFSGTIISTQGGAENRPENFYLTCIVKY